MRNTRSLQVVLVLFSLAITLPSAVAQVVIATVPVGMGPREVAVNSVTNKIYVANFGNGSGNTVTVIDGATNSAGPDIVVGLPAALAVNSVTNKIYVTNSDINGKVTVIDGAT